MRQKLVLTIAALSFALATAVGVGWAGAESADAPSTVESLVPAPEAEVPQPASDAPQCSNLADDDGDGLTDLEDPDCAEPGDDEEAAEEVVEAPPTPAPTEGT